MFKSARLKLTFWYSLIIIAVCTFFSIGMYKLSTDEFDRFSQAQKFRIERRYEIDRQLLPPAVRPRMLEPLVDDELVQELKNKVAVSLFGIDMLIFFAAGFLSYFLAGITLKPIKIMVDEQNRFISDASHELRTPLTALKSSMEVFLREPEPKLPDALALIKDSIGDVDNLGALATSLLQLTQYQKPNGNIHFEKLSSVELVKNAVSKILPMADKKKITITQHIEPVEFDGDKYSLTDLFVLLLDNAVKYSDDGKNIVFVARKVDGFLEFTITDEGMGIAQKDLPHIFERFYRSDISRTTSTTSGFGLGLSIAKKIVTIHKGTIFASSEQHKGSTFTIKLPISRKTDSRQLFS